jgi:hypothetical protein
MSKKYEIEDRDEVEFFNLLQMVKEDWEIQTRHMDTVELIQDRNKWITEFGFGEDDTDKMKQIIDIHTISIMMAQILKFGGVVYDV